MRRSISNLRSLFVCCNFGSLSHSGPPNICRKLQQNISIFLGKSSYMLLVASKDEHVLNADSKKPWRKDMRHKVLRRRRSIVVLTCSLRVGLGLGVVLFRVVDFDA